MVLLFSGANHKDSMQREAKKSLGGYISSTPVPNKKLNSLFSEISSYDLSDEGGFEVIAIFLKNDSKEPMINIEIESFSQRVLGDDLNLCDFEFSISELSEKGGIELIGSPQEEPYYVNWFKCESSYEDCIIELKHQGNVGEEFFIFDLEGKFEGFTFEDSIRDILKVLNDSGEFIATNIKSGFIHIIRKEHVITNANSNFVSSGDARIKEDVNLSNGKDGKVIIYDELLPNDSLGIWIKRTVNGRDKILGSDTCGVDKLNNIKKESLDIIFHYD